MTSEHTHSGVFKTTLPNTNITYRLARQDDLSKLEWMGEYAHFRSVFLYTFQEQTHGRRLMLIADFNDFPIGQLFILVKENSLLFQENSRRGYLYSLRVMQPFQRLGIGTQLLTVAENMMIERKLRYATIAAARDNLKARRLYEQNGYKVYAEDEGRWSYTDHAGIVVNVHEPCWLLEKVLR